MKTVFDNDFAYLVGNFMADGSFYFSDGNCRFEFCDGSPYKNELEYSLRHIQKIKKILEDFLEVKLPKIVKKENQFILKFRNKELTELFIKQLNILPGKKHRTVDIPSFYVDSVFEKNFWKGFLDGDGSIARNSRKISLESMSSLIIDSFSVYLNKNEIFFSKYISKRKSGDSYVIVIRSVSFRDFAKIIGFNHPLKSKLLFEKMKDRDFHVKNELSEIKGNGLVNYINFFDNSIYLEKGRELLIKYGYKRYSRENIKLNDVILFLRKTHLDDNEICAEIVKFRFKKSKGSINSVKLPEFYNNSLFKIARFVRIRNGGITISKRYVESFNEDFDKTLNEVQLIFDIKPKFTSKNEPIFCSGVLEDFFNKIIKRVDN